jgi:hypothetical protein
VTFEIEYWNQDMATRTVLVDLAPGLDLAAALKKLDKRFARVKRGRWGKGSPWLTADELVALTLKESA